jgi:hypothetical protein
MKLWTDNEFKQLKHLYCNTSMTSTEIAKEMSRTIGSVRMKIVKNGLHLERNGW